MQRDRGDVEASLQKKGFESVSGKGRAQDHRFYRYFSNGSPVPGLTTKVSLGTSYKSLGDPLLSAMARQCMLSKEQFVQLVDCPLTQAQYEAILRAQGALADDPQGNAE